MTDNTVTNVRQRFADAYASVSDRDWNIRLGGRDLGVDAGYTVEDPSTGDALVEVPACSAEDVDRIVRAALEAQQTWGATPPRARAAKVREFAALLISHREELAVLDAIDGGHALPAMRRDVDSSAELLGVMADYALQLGGQTFPLSTNLHYTMQVPYGVVARIIPFNHPLFFAATKAGPALMAGNAVVIKTPDQTPLSGLRMAELAEQVFGPDLCAVISGRGATAGAALVEHPLIRRIGFTGAPHTGRRIQRDAAAAGIKHVTLELGGKNALVVMEDADLGKAAASAVSGMNFTATAGQSCGSTSRLLLHKSVADEVTAEVVRQVKEIRVGHPLASDTNMGPVIDEAQYRKALDAVSTAVREGADVLAGGGRPSTVDRDGWFVEPTVLAGVGVNDAAAQQEIFGPVLSVLTFDTEDDAVRIANATEYGLTAGVFTRDVQRAHRMAHRMEAGYVWINGSSQHYWGLPFGGTKSSGVGREESVEELLSYTETKAVTVVLP